VLPADVASKRDAWRTALSSGATLAR